MKVLSAILATISMAPISAITGGEFDENNIYPSDGALMMDLLELHLGGYSPACSGVLVHPKVFLTAAHCITTLNAYSYVDDDGYPIDRPLPGRVEDAIDQFDGPGVWISFDNDPAEESPIEDKCSTCLDIERAIANPAYLSSPSARGDVGAIVLAREYDQVPIARLPEQGYFDNLPWKDLRKAPIINVGYGISYDLETKPKNDFVMGDKRQFSTSTIKSLDKDYIGLNMQSNQDNGGTCYGDSGGSSYYIDENGDLIVAGVTSLGDNNCISTDRSARTDVPHNYDFIQCILDEVNGSENYDECM